MDTTDARPTADETLTDADRAAIARALTEPGIALTADELATLFAGADDEVRARMPLKAARTRFRPVSHHYIGCRLRQRG